MRSSRLALASPGPKLRIRGWWGMFMRQINPYWVGLKSQWIIVTWLWIIKVDLVVFHIRVKVPLIAVVVFNLVISIWIPWRLHRGKRVFLVGQWKWAQICIPTLKHNKWGCIRLSVPLFFSCRHTWQGVSPLAATVCIWTHCLMLNSACQERSRGCQLFCCYCQPTLTSKQSVKMNFYIKIELHLQNAEQIVIASGSSAGITLWACHRFEFWSSRLQLRGKCCFWSQLTEQPKIKGMKFCFSVDFPLKDNPLITTWVLFL